MKWNAKRCISNIICIISATTLLWMVASYVEIICKNTQHNPTYSSTNIIVNIFEEVANND
jgi:hypothetical protein